MKTSVDYNKAYSTRNVWLYKHADFDEFSTPISGTDWHKLTTEANDSNHVTAELQWYLYIYTTILK